MLFLSSDCKERSSRCYESARKGCRMGRGRKRLGNDFPTSHFTTFRINDLENRVGQNCPIASARSLKIPKAKNRRERSCVVTEPRLKRAVLALLRAALFDCATTP